MRQTTSKDALPSAGSSTVRPRRDRRGSAAGERLCALTRRERPLRELIRFVAGPGDSIYIDLNRKLPGRGVWITADRSSIEAAVKSHAFARSLKRKVNVSPGLAEETHNGLRRRVCESLSLANKAGLVVTGFDKVSDVIERGQAFVLLHGTDAASGGRQKLDSKVRAVARSCGRSAVVFDCLTIDELSLAIGGPNVVHAAIKAGGAAERFAVDAERLIRFGRGLEAVQETASIEGPDDGPLTDEPSFGEAPS